VLPWKIAGPQPGVPSGSPIAILFGDALPTGQATPSVQQQSWLATRPPLGTPAGSPIAILFGDALPTGQATPPALVWPGINPPPVAPLGSSIALLSSAAIQAMARAATIILKAGYGGPNYPGQPLGSPATLLYTTAVAATLPPGMATPVLPWQVITALPGLPAGSPIAILFGDALPTGKSTPVQLWQANRLPAGTPAGSPIAILFGDALPTGQSTPPALIWRAPGQLPGIPLGSPYALFQGSIPIGGSTSLIPVWRVVSPLPGMPLGSPTILFGDTGPLPAGRSTPPLPIWQAANQAPGTPLGSPIVLFRDSFPIGGSTIIAGRWTAAPAALFNASRGTPAALLYTLFTVVADLGALLELGAQAAADAGALAEWLANQASDRPGSAEFLATDVSDRPVGIEDSSGAAARSGGATESLTGSLLSVLVRLEDLASASPDSAIQAEMVLGLSRGAGTQVEDTISAARDFGQPLEAIGAQLIIVPAFSPAEYASGVSGHSSAVVEALGALASIGKVPLEDLVRALHDELEPVETLNTADRRTLAALEELAGLPHAADSVAWVEFDGAAVGPGAGNVTLPTLFIRNMGRMMNRGGM
jgi:hypothetical protein